MTRCDKRWRRFFRWLAGREAWEAYDPPKDTLAPGWWREPGKWT